MRFSLLFIIMITMVHLVHCSEDMMEIVFRAFENPEELYSIEIDPAGSTVDAVVGQFMATHPDVKVDDALRETIARRLNGHRLKVRAGDIEGICAASCSPMWMPRFSNFLQKSKCKGSWARVASFCMRRQAHS